MVVKENNYHNCTILLWSLDSSSEMSYSFLCFPILSMLIFLVTFTTVCLVMWIGYVSLSYETGIYSRIKTTSYVFVPNPPSPLTNTTLSHYLAQANSALLSGEKTLNCRKKADPFTSFSVWVKFISFYCSMPLYIRATNLPLAPLGHCNSKDKIMIFNMKATGDKDPWKAEQPAQRQAIYMGKEQFY